MISGYFSYDTIRYVENIPNKCKDDLKVPDVRLLRPRTLIIHDNFKKKIFYIINIFKDEKISNYPKKYLKIKFELSELLTQSSKINLIKPNLKKLNKINVKSNTTKNKFLNMADNKSNTHC